jgi:hypothetical protein
MKQLKGLGTQDQSTLDAKPSAYMTIDDEVGAWSG